MIERVILNILRENGFDGYKEITSDYVSSMTFTYRKNSNKSEFFIVVSISEKDFINLDEVKVFSELSKILKESSEYTSEVDKNTSIVICICKDGKGLNPILEKKELQVEENPYFFKKYVLSYNKETGEKVFGDILKYYDISHSITNFIGSIITNPERFRAFKLNPENDDEFMLVSKIVMKVPIMPVKVPDNQSIKPLSSMMEDSISSQNLKKAQGLVAFLSGEEQSGMDESKITSQIINYWTER